MTEQPSRCPAHADPRGSASCRSQIAGTCGPSAAGWHTFHGRCVASVVRWHTSLGALLERPQLASVGSTASTASLRYSGPQLCMRHDSSGHRGPAGTQRRFLAERLICHRQHDAGTNVSAERIGDVERCHHHVRWCRAISNRTASPAIGARARGSSRSQIVWWPPLSVRESARRTRSAAAWNAHAPL